MSLNTMLKDILKKKKAVDFILPYKTLNLLKHFLLDKFYYNLPYKIISSVSSYKMSDIVVQIVINKNIEQQKLFVITISAQLKKYYNNVTDNKFI